MNSENVGDIRGNLHKRLLFLLLIAVSSTFLGIIFNIYIHEFGHYVMADFYGLHPSMHFSNGGDANGNVFSLILSNDFKAFVRFDDLDDAFTNMIVTLAGPVSNLAVCLLLFAVYFAIIRPLKNKKGMLARHFWLFLFLDTVMISIFIPSLLSLVINMLPIPNSDGSFVYGTIKAWLS